MLTPALYRTRITHLRRAPVHHYFEHRSYSWYIDIDALPDLPRWLQPFARFEASDHLDGEPNSTLRQRVERFLAERDIDLGGGKITALLQARVLGYVFNPLTLYWCHDADGVLQHVIAEVHNTYGGRHAYLLPPDSGQPAMVMKKLYVSPFNDVSGYYLVRAPRPDSELDVTISLHRENQPAFVATMRGERRQGRNRSDTATATGGAAGTADVVGGDPGPGHHAVVAQGSGGTAAEGNEISPPAKSCPARPAEGKGRAAVNVDIARLATPPISVDRWPDVARVPSGPLSLIAAPIAERLFRNAAARLPLRMVYPDGSVVGAADPTLPTMVIHRPDALARRIGRYGLIGFGESYMAGEWSSDDLAGVLTEFARSMDNLIPRSLQWFRPIAVVRQPRSQFNNREQARQNISEHYDLSNELFGQFLDETLTYSSAFFDTLPATRSQLADAQRRKIDRLLDSAQVGPGSRVLEIGTGWGELCIRAAARGATVRSVTLSAEQQQLARQRVAAAGLSDRVEIDLLDYRDVDGCYDAVVSVEMIEAVGYHFWPTYFKALDRLVAPGGRVSIQAITMPNRRMLASRNTYTWIQKYIFPGGLLPSVEAITGITGRHTRLRTVDMTSIGPHYAETLRLWRERFLSSERRCPRWASTGSSTVCGSCTWPTRRPDSGRATSTCSSGPSPRRAEPDELPSRHRRVRCRAVVHARHHVRGRPSHRALQRRRRDVGPGVRRRRGRRSGAGFRRSGPAAPPARPRLGVGPSTRMAHGPEVRGQGRGSAVRGAAGRRLLRGPRRAQDLPHPGRGNVVRLAADSGFGRPRARHRPRCSRF